jgi:hypothetical protein
MSEVRLAKKRLETTHLNPDFPDPDLVVDLFLILMMSLVCVELRVIPRL